MPRYAAATDANQAEIVKALRAFGVSVAITSRVGEGFPDLVVGYRGKNYLLEIKDPSKPKADRQLTPMQRKWHNQWVGQRSVVETIREALAVVGISVNS